MRPTAQIAENFECECWRAADETLSLRVIKFARCHCFFHRILGLPLIQYTAWRRTLNRMDRSIRLTLGSGERTSVPAAIIATLSRGRKDRALLNGGIILDTGRP